jgi:anthranilate phosphoribosyltransferase
LCRPIAEVLKRLGSEHVLVVHSDDGLDEISLAGSTQVAELHHGEITEYTIKPEDFGIQRQSLSGLSVDSPSASLALINTALTKNPDPVGQKAADIIALNAGAAIYAAGLSDTLKEGIILAQDAIGSGLAKEKMSELASFTQCFA